MPIISTANTTRIRNLIETRLSHGKQSSPVKTGENGPTYTLKELKRDISKATTQKEGFVREAAVKENRLLALLDGLNALWKDAAFTALLNEASKTFPELWLHTEPFSNGERLYSKLGWTPVKTEFDYYSPGIDAILMVKRNVDI